MYVYLLFYWGRYHLELSFSVQLATDQSFQICLDLPLFYYCCYYYLLIFIEFVLFSFPTPNLTVLSLFFLVKSFTLFVI